MPINLPKSIKDLTGKFVPKVEPPHLTMRVCMLGARGVGKTSVITSLYNSHKDAVSGTNLFLKANGTTQTVLESKKSMLNAMFRGLHAEGDLVTESGIPGDSSDSLFCFTYGMNSERINIDLEIRDYPGEFLRQEPDLVAEYIREANAVLIAIDTPCMMEEEGRYHTGKNRPQLVMDFLTQHLSSESEKLVLFVPLKCEKYYFEDRIDEVTERIQREYAPLLSHLRGQKNDTTGKKNVCCAITPIQTLGGVLFDSFERKPDGTVGEIMTPDGLALPEKINYRYAASNASYSPKYCEQPLYFLLAFVSMQYQQVQKQQNSSGLLARLREALRLIPKIDDFLLEIAMLGQRRLNGAHGYKILFGRGRLGG